MNLIIARILLSLSAAIFGFGGVMHALAFRTNALKSIERANLSPFLGNELKVLWLADTTTLIGLAFLFGYIALKPSAVTRTLLMLLVIIPAGTTALLYFFLGPFYAGHLLLAACGMALLAGFAMPAIPAPDRSA